MTGVALAHCVLGKFLGVVCHCFPNIYIYIYHTIFVAYMAVPFITFFHFLLVPFFIILYIYIYIYIYGFTFCIVLFNFVN